MARPLRIEYEGAFYHVTARGNVGSAVDIANAIVFLASDDTNYVTGQIFHTSGGSVMEPRYTHNQV